MIKNPAFYFNSELCTGCKACMIACIDKHNPVSYTHLDVYTSQP